MQILSYTLGVYLCAVSWFISGCDGLIRSENMNFSIIGTAHNIVIWRDNPNPGMILALQPEDVPQYQEQPINGRAANVDYNTHFVIFYFSGADDGLSLPDKQELVRVERFTDTISLHYDYESPGGMIQKN